MTENPWPPPGNPNPPPYWMRYPVDTNIPPADSSVCTGCGHCKDLHMYVALAKGCMVKGCKCTGDYVLRIPCGHTETT